MSEQCDSHSDICLISKLNKSELKTAKDQITDLYVKVGDCVKWRMVGVLVTILLFILSAMSTYFYYSTTNAGANVSKLETKMEKHQDKSEEVFERVIQALNKIDKTVSLSSQKVEQLTKTVNEHEKNHRNAIADIKKNMEKLHAP